MKAAYFDCFAGASGDMILGALLDAGLDPQTLRSALAKVPLSGYSLLVEKAQRGFLSGTKATVRVEPAAEVPERSLREILAIIDRSQLSAQAKEQGSEIFRRLAAAEAKVHGTTLEQVHLHEVAAVDALVDVMGAVAGLELLGVERVFCSPLPGGGGVASSRHGALPVPAPATLELLASAGAPLRTTPSGPLAAAEAVTPTGAAILTTLASFEAPTLQLQAIGYGAGSRDNPQLPNMLRLLLGEVAAERGELILIETNIDDAPPEQLGYAMEQLFAAGAKDVWFSPIQMKKNRPAVLLSVIAPRELEQAMVEALFRETSTFGMRVRELRRHEAERELVEFESSLGPVTVKLKRWRGALLGIAPEYEACRQLAQRHQLPLAEVYRRMVEEARQIIAPESPAP